MKPKSVYVSPFQLFTHEIYSEARKSIPKEITPTAANANLTAGIAHLTRQIVSGTLLFLLAALLVNGLAEDQFVQISTQIGEVSFPAIYLVFVGCFGYYITISGTLQAITLTFAQAKIIQAPWFGAQRSSANMLLRGIENFDFLSPIRPGNHFLLFFRHLLITCISLPLIIMLLPALAAAATYLNFLNSAFFISDQVFLSFWFEVSAISLLVMPTLFLCFISFRLQL